MSFSSWKKPTFNNSPANGLASPSTQQHQPVCTWSAHVPQSGRSPLPFPRSGHTLTATATVTPLGDLFLFGGCAPIGRASRDLYVFSTQDFSTTLLQTSGEAPTPRFAHGAALVGTSLLICGGKTDFRDRNPPNQDSIYLLDLGTSDLKSCQIRHQLIIAFPSSVGRVVPHCSQCSWIGLSLLPYHKRSRFQAIHLWWSDWREVRQ